MCADTQCPCTESQCLLLFCHSFVEMVASSGKVHAEICRVWQQVAEQEEISLQSNLDHICYTVCCYTLSRSKQKPA